MKQGYFTLQLVDAETERVFQEHTKQEQATPGGHPQQVYYAEVEPDREYYIQLSSSAMECVYVDVKIDGTVIEKGRKVDPASSLRMGVWKKQVELENNIVRYVETALRFDKAAVYERGTRIEAPKFWTGVIEAVFYGDPVYKIPDTVAAATAAAASPPPPPRTVTPLISSPLSRNPHRSTQNMHAASRALDFFGRAERSPPIYQPKKNIIYTDVSQDISGDVVGYCENLSDPKYRKGVKTVRGDMALSQFHKRVQSEEHGSSQTKGLKTTPKYKRKAPRNRAEEFPSYPPLGTISLTYCSAVGLIWAGILPKPPGWEYQQTAYNNPRTDNWRELSEAKVQVFRTEPVIVEGIIVHASTEFDLFDLLAEDGP
jgi:hypothetical protein